MNRSIRNVLIFSDAADYTTFRRTLVEGLERIPLGVLAFCLMPNHWHVVLRSGDIASMSRLMHWVTTTHAGRWHRSRDSRGLGPVYKGRFLAVALEDADDVMRVCRYVERNPLKAGLVDKAEAWHWSSLAERQRVQPAVPLVDLPILRSRSWVDYVNRPAIRSEEDEMEHLDEPSEIVSSPELR
jgi:putative transposase